MSTNKDPTDGKATLPSGNQATSLQEIGRKEGFEKSKQAPKASHDDISDYSEDWPDGSP